MAKMIQFARLDWKGDITVVIDPAFLSRSVIAEKFWGVEPWLSSSWTAMENTFQVLRHAFLPPNKIPKGLADVFSPIYNPHPKKVLHRNWDFSAARYIDFRSFVKARTPV